MQKEGITVHVVNTSRNMNIFSIIKATIQTIVIIKKEKYDIIHSHGSVLGIISRLAGLFTKASVFHSVHGFHFHKNMNNLIYGVFLWAEKILMLMSDVVLSQNYEDFKLLQSFNINKPIIHIGNGIKIKDENFKPRSLNSNHYVFCCIARFEEVKNHKMLFDTIDILKEEGLNFKLKCFGDGELESFYKNYVKEKQLAGHVEFMGYVENVFNHLTDVDLNFLPSIKEGLPRAILETMLIGIPTVATDVKGNNEVVEKGKTGFLVDLNDCQQMAKKALKVLQDPVLYTNMSRASRERVVEKFNEDRICDDLYKAYNNISGQR